MTRIYTSLAVVDCADGRFALRDKLPGVSLDDLQALTGANPHNDSIFSDPNVPGL